MDKANHLRGDGGQALVELALVLPVLLAILLGIMDFGKLFNTYLAVSYAAREGARVAAVGAADAEIESIARNASNGLSASAVKVAVSPEPASRIQGDSVTVTVISQVPIILPVLLRVSPDPLVVTGSSTMRVE